MAEMDNEFAKKLFYEGAILVCLDVPKGTEFGIDYNSWNVGPKFKGVKMIPPGFHFVFYAAVGRSGQTAPRTGFFQYFKQKEIIVKKWDPMIEDLVDQVLSDEEMERLRADLENLDQNLGKYPYESLKKWVSLSGHVTEPIMKKIEPVCKRVSSLTEVPQVRDVGDGGRNSGGDARRVACDTSLRFTPLPFRHFPAGASPAQITKLSMDKSEVLEEIMAKSTVKDILGELQLAFITFLVGQVYDAFEQWKHLIHLLCSCVDAVDKHPDVFEAFIGVIHFQLLETPQDFFVDIVSRNNFLVDNLHRFFMTVQDSAVSAKLKRKSQKFKEYLTKRFQWNFDEEPEEDAPVIVETQ